MSPPGSPPKSQVRRAGRILRDWWAARSALETADVQWAFDVLDAYRGAHAIPLNSATMALRSMVRTIHATGSVSQRLKRHFSIVTKLVREPTMQLARMHDVAGCRAVVESDRRVRELVERLIKNRDRTTGKSRVLRAYDYIAKPKPSGYRGMHVVVGYHGFLVEVQLRTEVQHEWSIAVERVGGRIGEDLKGGRGPQPVLEFFKLVSKAMAIEEAGRQVPRDLVLAVQEARRVAEPLMRRDVIG